jgi:hypothetical protein
MSGQFHAQAALPPGTHWIGGWAGTKAGLDVEGRKFLTLPGLELWPLGRPARSQSLYQLRYGSVARDGNCQTFPLNFWRGISLVLCPDVFQCFYYLVGFDVLKSRSIMRVVTLHSPETAQCFGQTYHFHLQGWAVGHASNHKLSLLPVHAALGRMALSGLNSVTTLTAV